MATATPAPSAARPGGSRRLRALAIAIVAVSWSLCVVAIALAATLNLPLVGEQNFAPLYLINAFVYGPVSALLIARRPNTVAIVLAALAIGSGISAVAAQYSALAVLDPSLPGAGVSQHVLDRLWLPGTLAAFCFVPLLLTSRPPSRLVKVLVAIGATASALPLLLTTVRQRPGAAVNPLAIPGEAAQNVLVHAFYVTLTVVVVIAVLSGIVLFWRWRFGPADDRRGTGWLLIGQWLLIVFFSPTLLAWLPGPAYFLADVAPLAVPLAQVFMPAAVLVNALGQRLWGVDVALNRAVMWVLLVAALLVGYVAIATALSRLLPVPPTSAGVIAVAALALGIEPLRRWIQRRVDSLVYGDAADPAALMRSLGSKLSGDEGEGLQPLMDALRPTLRIGRISVHSAQQRAIVAQSGQTPESEASVRIPLLSAHEQVGTLTVTGEEGQRVDRRTVAALERIAGVLTVALQLFDANREAEEARENVLGARDEERRMVRRELHDGLAPTLATAAVGLGIAIDELGSDPNGARRRIANLRADLSTLTNEVRDLARTLLPGALDSGDLDGALTELAERFSSDRLEISIASKGDHELDPTRQAAVYHVIAEVVLLARRTPGVDRLDVIVDRRDDRSTVIRLDHAALAAAPGLATVLASVRDRAEELGGSLTIGGAQGLHLVIEVPS